MNTSTVLILFLVAIGVNSTGVTIGITPDSHPVLSQYHSQDLHGQYSYGYATPTSSKSEIKTADGVTRGGYSYIDSNGILQTVDYVSDPVHGFRVAASNLPQDLPEVAYAKAKHLAEFEAIKQERAAISAQIVRYSNPVAYSAGEVQRLPIAPEPVQDLPEVVKAREEHLATVEAIKARNYAIGAQQAISADFSGSVVPIRTRISFPVNENPAAPFLSYTTIDKNRYQDKLGPVSYGYMGPLNSHEKIDTDGGYSYLDENGKIQSVQYVSDPERSRSDLRSLHEESDASSAYTQETYY